MQFCDFEEQIFSIDRAIHREISERPLTRQARAAKDLIELRLIVRRAAEDLILCADVKEAIARLRQDPKALLAVEALTSYAPDEDDMLAIRRAHAATLHDPSELPFHAFCSYLIELCDLCERLEPGSPNV